MKKLSILFLILFSRNAFSIDVSDLKVARCNGQIFITWKGDVSKEYVVYRSTTKITAATGWPAVPFGRSPAYSSKNTRLTDVLANGDRYFKVPVNSNCVVTELTPDSGYGGLFVLTCTDKTATKYFYGVKRVGSNDPPAPGKNTTKIGVVDDVVATKSFYQESIDADGINGNDLDIYAHFVTAIVPQGGKKMMNSGYFDFIGYNYGIMPYSDLGSSGPHPVIVKLHGGGSNFIEDAGSLSEEAPSAYKLFPDDWLPNAETDWFFGYNEDYDIGELFQDNVTPPPSCHTACELNDPACHGANYDYTIQRLLYTIDQLKTIYNKPPNTNPADDVDITRISITGKSMGGGGTVIAALLQPNVFSAARAQVPKVDFSDPIDTAFPDICPFNFDIAAEADENPCYDPELYFHPRERTNSKWGTVTSNWTTNIKNLNGPGKYDTYELLDAGNMIAQNAKADKDIPLLFIISGKKDGGVGWDEKPPLYDSANTYRQGSVFFWDQGAHHSPTFWDWGASIPISDLIRYSTKQAYPAFSDCSANGSPAADSGNINGFIDWDETSIIDNSNNFSIKLKWRELKNIFGGTVVPSNPNITTDMTLRREKFPRPYVGTICWTLTNLTTSVSVSGESFVATSGGPVFLDGLNLHYPDEYQLTMVKGSCKVSELSSNAAFSTDKAFPNPFTQNFTVEFFSYGNSGVAITVTDVYGKVIDRLDYIPTMEGQQTINLNGESWSEGIYNIEIAGGNQKEIVKAVKVR